MKIIFTLDENIAYFLYKFL